MGNLPTSITLDLDEATYILDALDILDDLATANGDLALKFTAEEAAAIITGKLNPGLPPGEG